MRLPSALIVLTAALAALPAAAHAGDAGFHQVSGEDIAFSGGPGEVNRVTVTGQGAQGVIIEDSATPITPGEGCTAVTPNRVACQRTTFVFVELEDGDDEVTTAGDFGTDTFLFLDGDQGSDTIHGEVGQTRIEGGTGTDRLFGGPDTSDIEAVDVVRRGEFQEIPDHNRERDEVTCAASADAEPLRVRVDAVDALAGPCPPHYVFLESVIVHEGTAGNDSLFGLTPPTRINGLGGDDVLTGEGEDDRLDGGTGDDRLFGQGLVLGGEGDDRVDGGERFSPPGGARLDGQAGRDFVLGSRSGDSLSGGTGRDTIAGGRGNDSIRARDRERDTVTCGSGRDRVSADRGDAVSSDCEVVSRG